MTNNRFWLLLALTVAGNCWLSTARDIVLDNNGRYNDVLVSVSQNIPEDWELVQRIKDGFQQASQRLAVASRINGSRSFAFGHVYILVPRSWSNQSVDSSATWHTEDAAHFRVDQRGSQIPNTVQPGDCGQPGLHVNLHREHLRDTSAEDLGKQLVHEFAHLRWGVFNEYNGALGPHAFLHQGRLSPVRCSASITGKFGHKDTGNPCKVDRVTLELEPDCRFILDSAQTAQASLMYTTYLASVRQFCQPPSGDPDFDHNVAAPNPQNRRCYGRSVQSVMLEHADYKKAIDGSETDTTVNFTVVQPRGARRLVIVMDVSGSMGTNQGAPLAKMKIAVRTLLLGLLEDGIQCAMTSFSTSSTLLRDLDPLDSAAIRRDYWRIVAGLTARGSTAIGGALAAAMELLGADMNRPSKEDTGYILLLTDGIENHTPRYTLAQATAIAARTSIVVDTVAFGSQADKRLAELSAVTGGKAYFARFNSPANDLMEAMSDMVRDRVDTSQKPIDVFSTPVPATFTEHVVLDESISKGAQFTLSSPAVADIKNADLRVVSPSGVEYSSLNGSNYLREETAGVVSIGTEGKIEAGSWTIHGVRKSRDLPKPTNNGLSLVVTSRPTDAAPIILDGLVSPAKLVLRADTRVSVFATLSQGSELLSGAEILASVESDTGVDAEFKLLDDGFGADAIRGDGVYSGFVPTQVNQVREYNVRLTASKPVSRVSTAGKFEVTGVDQGSLSRTPPARIGDLRARISLGSRAAQVGLEFTAVGARRMEGSASRYIVWLCTKPEPLASSSPPDSSSPGCSNRTLLNSSIEAAGSPISVPVPPEALSGLSVTVYLAVAAENSDKILGQLSNVASVQTSLPDNLDEVERTDETGDGLTVLAIVFIAVGVALAVALIVGVGIYLIVKKKNSGTTV
ncbi:hypothetical protein BOX15_Mlig024505g3 [Macrostomum lignano]|uniref:VWFA domain-containing protein n=1 Tax=Macrostomum lignano TaxID=282301 RepID=A0A267GGI1_9PLAT|nr:hypothetical protein BOX15_Mlig024505g3 [Macrostomum lignano]